MYGNGHMSTSQFEVHPRTAETSRLLSGLLLVAVDNPIHAFTINFYEKFGNVSASRRLDDDDISKAGEKEFKSPFNRGRVRGTGAGDSVRHRPPPRTASRNWSNLAWGEELSMDTTVQY
jgi:hypothetical protein